MTVNETAESLLLVMASTDQKRLEPLIKQLASVSDIDSYTLRQRLTGSGLAQLAHGSKAHLQPLVQPLRQHQIDHWLIQPAPANFTPRQITGLSVNSEQVIFTTLSEKPGGGADRVILNRGDRLLAVVADISGRLGEKQLKRLMVHNTYNGIAPAPLSTAELKQQIFKFTPVIDLYWRDSDGNVSAAVRILPGSFDHRQLGERSSLSRNGNLMSLLELFKEYAADMQTDYNFGLGFLPNCQPEQSITDSISKKNLQALTCYGKLLVDIANRDTTESDDQNPLAALLTTELSETLGLSAATGPLTQTRQDHDGADHDKASTKEPAVQATLPPPPEVETRSGIKLHFTKWRIVSALGGAVVVLLSQGRDNLPTVIYKYGIVTGLIPALVGIAALWGAVHFWRLKHRIENTPTSKARSAAMGMIEVSGRAKRLYALVSPISQLPCVYYCLKKYQRNKRDDSWRVTQVTTSGNVPFVLEDETGSIRIDPQGAQLNPQYTTEGFPGQNTLLFSTERETNHYEKWKEEVLHDGCNLYVLGFAHSLATGEGKETIRHRVGEKLRELKSDREKLLQYDSDNDGKISTTEWDRARSDMEQQALREKLHHSQQRSNQQLVIGRPPQKGLPFIIAETESETKLTRNYSWYIPVLLFTAVTSIIVALRSAANYFHLY